MVLIVLSLLLFGLAGGSFASSRATAQETDVASFLGAFLDAWATGTFERVLPLFAPEAVVVLDHEELDRPEEYRGGSGPAPLRVGVSALLRPGVQLDLAGAQLAAIMFRGVPATSVRWTYQHPGSGLRMPPEVGTDELVVRDGRILAYTRTQDNANRTIRGLALQRHASSIATQIAQAKTLADLSAAASSPSERGTPTMGPWVIAAGLALVGVLVLAAFKRPTEL